MNEHPSEAADQASNLHGRPLLRIECSHCPSCGYDLTGLEASRCPECGYDADDALYAAPYWLSFSAWMGTADSIVAFIIGMVLVVIVGTAMGLWLPMPWNLQPAYPAAIVALLTLWIIRPIVARRIPLKRRGEPLGVVEFRSHALQLRMTNVDTPVILPWSTISDLRLRRVGRTLHRLRPLPYARWPLLSDLVFGFPSIFVEADEPLAAHIGDLAQQLRSHASMARDADQAPE